MSVCQIENLDITTTANRPQGNPQTANRQSAIDSQTSKRP